MQFIDQYYQTQVNTIISNVTECLTANPIRRFNQVEMAYFHKWWIVQTPAKQEEVTNSSFNILLHRISTFVLITIRTLREFVVL